MEVKIMAEKARDYKQEYRDYHGRPEQIRERAQRNAARAPDGPEGRRSPRGRSQAANIPGRHQ